jgi:uncharacterized protein
MDMVLASRSVIGTPIEEERAVKESERDRGYAVEERERIAGQRSIWIDLDNSPHVPFFLPIIEELRKRDIGIFLTARNTYQVCDLLEFFQLQCKVVGKHYGKHRTLKILGNILRACQLMPSAGWRRPDLAISHGSRAQIVVGKVLRIPTLMMQDYEHSARTGFLEADWILTPEVVPNQAMSRRPDRVMKYPGLKEDVYVPYFRPDPAIREQFRLSPEDLVVTLRPPATEAHYHNPEGDMLFAEAVKFLDRPHVKAITLPRSHKQHRALCDQWANLIASGRMIIPESALDGLNLIWFSDLVISGGGTMNREAAALGTPVYSIFRGTIGAVDRYLAEQGRLTLIETVADIEKKIMLRPWNRPTNPDCANRPALRSIVDSITAVLTAATGKAS